MDFGFPHKVFGRSVLVYADCFEWLTHLPDNSISAVVTDPPFGVKEFEDKDLSKRGGRGGVWRIPPSFDGSNRSPVPRFTALTLQERKEVESFFSKLSTSLLRTLHPGGHVFLASNSFLAQTVFSAMSGLEFRGQVIRLVRTLRGGDRPKGAEKEFPGTSTMPRGCYEPWGLFRKPLPAGMTVSQCLRTFGTGALRRPDSEHPFEDVIESGRTPRAERKLAPHPSLKPQSFLRKLVWASLPLGRGVILDPFAGSGSTVAAAQSLGLQAVGVERNDKFFEMAVQAIPALAALPGK